MSSVFTEAELDQQIAAYKEALKACASGQSVRMNTGGVDRLWTSADLPEIRKTLEWLAAEKQRAAAPGSASRAAGRTYAKQGGTGRW